MEIAYTLGILLDIYYVFLVEFDYTDEIILKKFDIILLHTYINQI